MVSHLFAGMSDIFKTIFKTDGDHFWHRYDHPDALPLELIFNELPTVVDTEGFSSISSNPTADVLISDALRVAPDRAHRDPTLTFDDRDYVSVNGVRYRVGSCTHIGLDILRLDLISPSHQESTDDDYDEEDDI